MIGTMQGEQFGRNHRCGEEDRGRAREQAQTRQLNAERGLRIGEVLERHGNGRRDEALVDSK